jgi:hypothetical protein
MQQQQNCTLHDLCKLRKAPNIFSVLTGQVLLGLHGCCLQAKSCSWYLMRCCVRVVACSCLSLRANLVYYLQLVHIIMISQIPLNLAQNLCTRELFRYLCCGSWSDSLIFLLLLLYRTKNSLLLVLFTIGRFCLKAVLSSIAVTHSYFRVVNSWIATCAGKLPSEN